MSDTPRSDKAEDEAKERYERFREVDWPAFGDVGFDFARQFERENNRIFKINEALMAENAEMEIMLRDSKEVLDEYAKDGKHRAAYDASLRIYGFLRRYNSQNK